MSDATIAALADLELALSSLTRQQEAWKCGRWVCLAISLTVLFASGWLQLSASQAQLSLLGPGVTFDPFVIFIVSKWASVRGVALVGFGLGAGLLSATLARWRPSPEYTALLILVRLCMPVSAPRPTTERHATN